jgi:hypothetical protein
VNPLTGLFDLLLAPFGGHARVALAAISLLCGVATIFIFRATSNQAGIRRARSRVVAHVLEMRIYQDDLVLILRALGATLVTNLRYLRVVAWPIVLIGLVVGLAFTQLDARFARSPLQGDGTALVTVTYRPGIDVMGAGTSLEAGEGAVLEGARVRVPARREVSWRVRVVQPGSSPGNPALTARAGNASYRFALAAEPGTGVVGDRRSRSFLDGLLHPGLPALGRRRSSASRSTIRPRGTRCSAGARTGWWSSSPGPDRSPDSEAGIPIEV